MLEEPRRDVYVTAMDIRRFLAASDAALETPRNGTGGYWLIWNPASQGQLREGAVADIPTSIYDLWTDSSFKIAQLELLMVLVALVNNPAKFRHARGIWCIGSVAALMAVVRGRSDSPELDQLAGIIHAVLFAFETWTYFEWVQSNSNWADGISRYAEHDRWHQRQGFSCTRAPVPLELWHLPVRGVVRVAEFL